MPYDIPEGERGDRWAGRWQGKSPGRRLADRGFSMCTGDQILVFPVDTSDLDHRRTGLIS